MINFMVLLFINMLEFLDYGVIFGRGYFVYIVYSMSWICMVFFLCVNFVWVNYYDIMIFFVIFIGVMLFMIKKSFGYYFLIVKFVVYNWVCIIK